MPQVPNFPLDDKKVKRERNKMVEFIASMKPGDRFMYYRGFFAMKQEEDERLTGMKEALHQAFSNRLCLLYQKKISPYNYEYYVQRRHTLRR